MNGDTTQKIKAIIKERYDTFTRIHINHVYRCENTCQQYFSSKSLVKRDNLRVCPNCGRDVKDVTFTIDRQYWMAMARPDLDISKNDVRSTSSM